MLIAAILVAFTSASSIVFLAKPQKPRSEQHRDQQHHDQHHTGQQHQGQ
jgi:hypothetical protein